MVKVVRPGIRQQIRRDIDLLMAVAAIGKDTLLLGSSGYFEHLFRR